MLSHMQRVIALARKQGVLRSRDLIPFGIPRSTLGRLVARGELIRIARGLYMSPKADITEHHSLVEVCVRLPKATINLLSALLYYEFTDELPHKVWIALPRGSQVPGFSSPKLELTWTLPKLMNDGIRQIQLEGRQVTITSPARTVVDCFKFRNKIGTNIAISALRDYLVQFRNGLDEFWRLAGIFRVQNVIRPYLETLL